MKKYLCCAAVSALLAAPALAGNIEEARVEPVIIPPAPVSDWTGFYAGGQLGFGRTSSITVPGGPETEMPLPQSIPSGIPGEDLNFGKLDGGLGGVHVGYLHNIGKGVVGAELDYDWGKLSSSADYGAFFVPSSGDTAGRMEPAGTADLKVDQIGRIKLIAGYDLGDGLIYGTAGAFRAEMKGTWAGVSGRSSDNGWLVGAGYKHKFTENWIGGLEVLYHEATNFDGKGFDLKMTTASARVSYQF